MFLKLASLHATNHENTIYDIVPVVNEFKQKKRSISRVNYDSLLNSHQIKKRNVNSVSFCNVDASNLKTKIDSQFNSEIKKERALNGQPINLYVELFIVADQTIYLNHKKFLKTNDSYFIFESMKIYYSHLISGVNQQYVNSLANDTDMRIYFKAKNFLFYTVNYKFNYKQTKIIKFYLN